MDCEIENVIKEWFRYAGGREVGRKSRGKEERHHPIGRFSKIC